MRHVLILALVLFVFQATEGTESARADAPFSLTTAAGKTRTKVKAKKPKKAKKKKAKQVVEEAPEIAEEPAPVKREEPKVVARGATVRQVVDDEEPDTKNRTKR